MVFHTIYRTAGAVVSRGVPEPGIKPLPVLRVSTGGIPLHPSSFCVSGLLLGLYVYGLVMVCYRCSICLEFVSVSIQTLVKHIGRIHRSEPNFHVVCGIEGCSKTFKKFLSFNNHLIRKHKIVAKNNVDNVNENATNEELEHQQEENPGSQNPSGNQLIQNNALSIEIQRERTCPTNCSRLVC